MSVFLVASILSIVFSVPEEKPKKEIIPLKSKRAEVERHLGKPNDEKCVNCIYETTASVIVVRYAVKKCEGAFSGWNVPRGTVLSYTVEPKQRKLVKIPKYQSLISFSTDDLTRYYTDVLKGITYTISPQSELISSTRLPINSDNNLRCAGFPKYDIAGTSYKPIDEFDDTNLDEAIARLQNHFIHLTQSGRGYKLYAVVYSGDNLAGNSFDNYFDRLRTALADEISQSPSKLELIDGGRRKRFEVNLFFIKKGDPPPSPLPDFAR
jgi:hypothetical protein